MTVRMITEHEGKKYLRRICAACQDPDGPDQSIEVDVYEVLVAFGVVCPARQHAVKKILCAGLRDKGSELDDLKGALAALCRAIEIQARKEKELAP